MSSCSIQESHESNLDWSTSALFFFREEDKTCLCWPEDFFIFFFNSAFTASASLPNTSAKRFSQKLLYPISKISLLGSPQICHITVKVGLNQAWKRFFFCIRKFDSCLKKMLSSQQRIVSVNTTPPDCTVIALPFSLHHCALWCSASVVAALGNACCICWRDWTAASSSVCIAATWPATVPTTLPSSSWFFWLCRNSFTFFMLFRGCSSFGSPHSAEVKSQTLNVTYQTRHCLREYTHLDANGTVYLSCWHSERIEYPCPWRYQAIHPLARRLCPHQRDSGWLWPWFSFVVAALYDAATFKLLTTPGDVARELRFVFGCSWRFIRT